ncbi:MAG: hypothetical protein R6U89_01430 [Dehalococcoidia bacterium]
MNEHPEIINQNISANLSLTPDDHIQWVSPLNDDDFAEYRDQEFIDMLGLELNKQQLNSFWPTLGPAWDGLAKTTSGNAILIEAKSHIPELVSVPSSASPNSLVKIHESLDEVKRFLKGHEHLDWASCFYQYTNRLAHLYFLRELNNISAYLAFVCFVNDTEMEGPKTEAEWKGAIYLLESFLGIHGHRLSPYVFHLYIDVSQLKQEGL